MSNLTTIREQQLADAIEDVTKELTESTASQQVITEDFFVNVFLPMFSGTAATEMEKKVTPEMWFNLAHGPFNEVVVVNAQGQHLFNVPPFYSQQIINPLDGTGKAATLPTITDMVRTAQNHAFSAPGQGEAYLQQELERRSFMFNPDADLTDDNKRWNEIFTRYGRKPPVADQPLNKSDPNAPIDRDSTEFDSLC